MTGKKRSKPALIETIEAKRSSFEDAKDLVRLIVAIAGGRLEGKTRLFKAFYAAHLFHYKSTGRPLTDYPIVHMPHGPGIHNSAAIFGALIDSGELGWEVDRSGVYPEESFSLLAPMQVDPADPRYQAVSEAVEWAKSKSAAALSLETHEKSRSWRDTTDGEEMYVYADLLTDEEVEQRKAFNDRAVQLVRTAFGG